MGKLNTILELLKSLSSDIVDLKTISLSDRKNFQLAYVTAERAKWRENIRSIVEELVRINLNLLDPKYPTKIEDLIYVTDPKKEYKKCLARLKANINAYGMVVDKSEKEDSYYEKDGHIHNIIKRNNNNDIEQLIDYLSLLLKFDWQRSKDEAQSVEVINEQSKPDDKYRPPKEIYIEAVKSYEKKHPLA